MLRSRIRLSAAFALLASCIATLAPTQASADGPWSGQWDSHWRTGRARLVLSQEGDAVRGNYFPRDGEIEGTVDEGGRVLRGRFEEAGRHGTFTFSLAPDGQSFMGRFDSGEWWNGGRLSASTNVALPEAELSSPRDAMRSFLTAFNEIRYGGLDFVDAGLTSVDFGEDVEGAARLTPTERFRRARLLFDVIDACVLHLWDLPDAARAPRRGADGAASFTHHLRQLGTGHAMRLRFSLSSDGVWRLVAPPNETLLELRTAMRRARGETQPDPQAHFALPHPRGTIRTFIEQVKRWDEGGREHVLRTMDLSEVDPEVRDIEAPLLAEYLKQVLDRAGFLIWQELPNDPRSQEPYVHFAHPLGEVVVAPHVDPDHPSAPPVWRFTPETLRDVRALYDAFEDLPVAEGLVAQESRSLYFRLRSWFRHWSPSWVTRIGPIERWQALAVLTLVLAAFGLVWIAGRLPWWMAWLTRRRDEETRQKRREVGRRYALPLGMLVSGLLLHALFERTGVPPDILWALGSGSLIAAVLGGTWTFFSALDDLGAALLERAHTDDSSVDAILVSLLTSVAKIVIVVAGVFLAADILQIPYRTVFAGLGIGGLAFAIAAQDTLANFFGSAVLLADRPFHRGDLVHVREHLGFVEHVGLRSTHIRTFEDSVVVIPNRVLAAEVIDNRGRRRVRALHGTVSATYDATPETLDGFVTALRTHLARATGRSEDQVFVGVSAFADSAIAVDFRTTFDADDFAEEVARRHALLVDVARLADAHGVEFAFPTRTVHVRPAEGGSTANAANPASASGTSNPRDAELSEAPRDLPSETDASPTDAPEPA